MPTLAIIEGYRFFFWSLDLGEPPHVHVEGHGGKAKFWRGSFQSPLTKGMPVRVGAGCTRDGMELRQARSRLQAAPTISWPVADFGKALRIATSLLTTLLVS